MCAVELIASEKKPFEKFISPPPMVKSFCFLGWYNPVLVMAEY